MPAFFRPFLSFILLAAAARAQTLPPSAPPGPPHDHADEPVLLEHIVVTAAPGSRNQSDIATPTNVLTGHSLALKLRPTLGETLAGQSGIASTYFGPGASRPVIRGLGGDRIRILENSLGTIDASTASPDHAVSLDPMLVERVEVVRGPATLLYGGNAVGGVVNVIDNRIPHTVPSAPARLRLDARAGSADDSRSGALAFDGGAGAFAWHADAYRRTADDVRIPGFAETAALRHEADAHAAEAGEPAPAHPRGRIANTSLSADGAALGLAYIRPTAHLGLSFGGHNTRYGIPPGTHVHDEEETEEETAAEEATAPRVRIDLKQRRLNLHAGAAQLPGFFEELRLKYGYAEYRHQEIEDGAIGTVFKNRGYDSRLELLHRPLGLLSGALGAQLSHNDLGALGDEAFLPPSHTANLGLFLYEEADLKPVTWQFGARLDRQRIALRDNSGLTRDGHATSLSTGLTWNATQRWTLGASLSRSERLPNAQELFARGPHAGTGAYEIGDIALAGEKSLALDVSLRRRAGFITGELTVFANRFNRYIYERATGGETDGLAEYAYTQQDVEFRGAEIETLLHLHETKTHGLDLRFAADTVRAEIRRTGETLPRLTPDRVTVGLACRGPVLTAGLHVQRVDRARRLAPGETATPGHTLLGADLTCRFAIGKTAALAYVNATNLTDREARAHNSFLKDVAPLPGRDLTAGLRLSF